MIKAIAEKLYISPKTVHRHLANLRQRYGFVKSLELTNLFFLKKNDTKMRLTNRENEILRLASEGFSSRQISLRLGISFSTVRRHKENMLLKNECSSMRELLAHFFILE